MQVKTISGYIVGTRRIDTKVRVKPKDKIVDKCQRECLNCRLPECEAPNGGGLCLHLKNFVKNLGKEGKQ